jgi:hypothetical protein
MGKSSFVPLAGLIFLLGSVAVDLQGEDAGCIDGNVAFAQPVALWGELRPGVTGRIPAARDSTNYTGQQLPDSLYPNFSSLDIENGWVFVSYSLGIQAWDARGARQADPQLVGERDAARCGDFLVPPFECSELGSGEARWSVWDLDAPAGKDDVVAAFGRAPVSLTVWDATVKSNLVPKYQETGGDFNAGWAATIAGRDYAFAAGTGTNGLGGISVYDMTAAKALAAPCFENTAVATACGVRRQRISPANPAVYVDGFQRSDGRTFLVHSARTALSGLELWDVSSIAAPDNLRAGGGRFLAGTQVYGVALWEQSGCGYLGAWILESSVNEFVGRIYDVTACLADNGCSELPAPVRTLQRTGPLGSEYLLTFSRGTGGTPYLYFGQEGKCLSGRQKEWLYDVTPLAAGGAPLEITPDRTLLAATATEGPVAVDYWSYAYARNPGGFSEVMPRVGKFSGDWFYRVAWTLFDTHQRVTPQSLPLAADFVAAECVAGPCSFPSGTAIAFTDLSAGAVASSQYFYDWNHTGSSAAGCQFGFGSASPILGHTFATPGAWTPCLKVTRGVAESSVAVHGEPIVVTGAASLAALALSGPLSGRTGQVSTLTASASGCAPGATGWSWSLAGGVVEGPATGASVRVAWSSGGAKVVAVTQPACPGASASRTLAITASGPSAGLVAELQYHPIGGSRIALDASPSIGASGSCRWTLPGGIVKLGPRVSHDFGAPGTYPVTLEVWASGCEGAGCPSATVTRAVQVDGTPE